MLGWAVLFLIITLVAGVFGFAPAIWQLTGEREPMNA